jgi:uncharacterized protein with HEPN domain
MAATRYPRARLEHILFHIKGIADTVGGINFDTFTTVYHMERTVERAIEVISEAARALPPDLVAKYPQIEWQKIVAIGNLLRHEYYRVDPATMWDIATVRLPELEPVIIAMLKDLKE